MEVVKVELKKPISKENDNNVALYGYGENSTNDAPRCDKNGNIANCKC